MYYDIADIGFLELVKAKIDRKFGRKIKKTREYWLYEILKRPRPEAIPVEKIMKAMTKNICEELENITKITPVMRGEGDGHKHWR